MTLYEFEGKRPVIGKDTFIHPQSIIIGDVEVGEGCFIGACAVLRADFGRIVIGNGTNVQDNCTIHADTDTIAVIGDNVLIGHGAIIHGPCVIEEYVVIGMGAICSTYCELGRESMLAAGSILPPGRTVPPQKLAVGSPATTYRDMGEQILKNRSGLREYQEMTVRCIKDLKLIAE